MRKILDYGFVSYTGRMWANCQVDSYNAIQTSINRFIAAALPVPEYLITGSHNLMVSYSGGFNAQN